MQPERVAALYAQQAAFAGADETLGTAALPATAVTALLVPLLGVPPSA